MPRDNIEIPCLIHYISIFDENGNLDEDLEPKIDEELLLKMHRYMFLGRLLDERMLNLQRQGRIGTFATIRGQEASQVGPVAALRDSDWLVPAFREHAAQIMRGLPIENMLLVYGGFYQGSEMEEDIRTLPNAVPVSTQTLHAVGIGYGIKYRKEDGVAMVFFGDGATSEGDFHEAMNFAEVFDCPVIFVCQNNQWAISVPREVQTESKTLAQKAFAYGMRGVQVDGNDFLATYVAAKEAIDRARAGEGPTFIENVTYRLSLHTTADDPKRYRLDEEVERWEKCDPIPRVQNYLKMKGILTDEKIESIREELQEEIQTAVDRYEVLIQELANEHMTMFDHMYEEMPPYLKEQRDELAQEMEE